MTSASLSVSSPPYRSAPLRNIYLTNMFACVPNVDICVALWFPQYYKCCFVATWVMSNFSSVTKTFCYIRLIFWRHMKILLFPVSHILCWRTFEINCLFVFYSICLSPVFPNFVHITALPTLLDFTTVVYLSYDVSYRLVLFHFVYCVLHYPFFLIVDITR